jgi:hypothetical protein
MFEVIAVATDTKLAAIPPRTGSTAAGFVSFGRL